MMTDTVKPTPDPGGVVHVSPPVQVSVSVVHREDVIRRSVHSSSPMNTVLSSAELPKFSPVIVIRVPPLLGPMDGVTSVIFTRA